MPNADQIIDLFTEAKAHPAGPERERFLADACGGDAALREQIVSLIEAEADDRSELFDRGLVRRSAILTTEKIGDRIGRFKLLEKIGEGGCGVVYMAEQEEPVRRRVALKVIKLGMDTKSVVARFEAERQALALMDHPNIAKVFDGGATETGRPYFVMELVRGTKITDFCDQNSVPIEERLRLFINVCEAIQHAHLKGIIHRDIKPSNILVSSEDGKVVPKVIDFGIAKATEQTLTDKTIFTAFEQFIGTPAYMSPEQAERTNVDIDTRSDIYSLGVLLYELLTGHTPFDSKALIASGMHEVQRIIRESEPPKPSQRLSTLAGAELTTVAGRRLSEPPKLLHRVRGDLDWIPMKCLEKDRARRYETASELAADLQRHLNNEPVLASPPSLGYRLRKLARRHKVTAITGGLALLLVMLALIGTTWGMLQASRAEKRAIAEQKNSARLLFNSLVSEARATRLSGQLGSRFESLDVLRRARQSAKELQLSGGAVRTMRNEAIASMAGADFQLEEPWTPYPADSNSVDFDESLSICAIANQNGDCSIRRTGTQTELHFIPGLGKPAAVALSPDARYAVIHHATNGAQGFYPCHVWDLGAPTPRRVFSEPGVFQASLRNSELIAFGYVDGSIKVFNLPDGKELYRIGPTKLVREVQLALHPSEPLIATSSYFGREVEIRDLRTGEVISSLPQQRNASRVVWTPDGRLAVGFAEAKCVKIYQRDALQPEQTIDTLQAVTMIAFSKANNMMAVRGWNDILEVYDLSTGARVMRMKPNTYGVPKFSADGLRLASAARGGQMRIFKVRPSTEYRQLARQGGAPGNLYWRCSLHPEGRLLAVAMTDGIVFWDLAFGREVGFIPSPGSFHRVLFEPSGSLLVGTLSGLARWPITPVPDRLGVFELGPPRQLPFPGPEQITQSGDGRVIATAHRAVGVNLPKAGAWISRDDQSNAPINLDPGADILEVAASSDARWVVTTTHASGISKLWDAQTGKFLKLLAPWGTACARFTRDSRWLILSGAGGQIFSTETWTPVRSSNAIALMPSPDSRLGAVLNEDGVSLVEVLTGEEIAILGSFNSEDLADMMFSPDGTRLLVLDHKQGVKVWNLRQIRERLSAMDLDWNYPAFPPAPKAAEPLGTPIRLRISDLKSPP